MFNQGDKVTRVTPHKKEKGIVKRPANENQTFVVYNCGDEWDNFTEYTAARTDNSELVSGWN